VELPATIKSRVEALEAQISSGAGFALTVVSFPNSLAEEGGVVVLPDESFVVVESDGTQVAQSVMLPSSVFSESTDVVVSVANGTGKRLTLKARSDDTVNGILGAADYVVQPGQAALCALVGTKEWVVTGLRVSTVEADSLVDQTGSSGSSGQVLTRGNAGTLWATRGLAETLASGSSANNNSITGVNSLSAASVTSSGAVSAGSVVSSGAVTAASVAASGAVTAGSVTSTGAVSSASMTSSGHIQCLTLRSTDTGAASIDAAGGIKAASAEVTGTVLAQTLSS
jgi:hypothetical protein